MASEFFASCTYDEASTLLPDNEKTFQFRTKHVVIIVNPAIAVSGDSQIESSVTLREQPSAGNSQASEPTIKILQEWDRNSRFKSC